MSDQMNIWDSLFFFGLTLILFGKLCQIERNTRPPKPDLKSFIKQNTKGDQ